MLLLGLAATITVLTAIVVPKILHQGEKSYPSNHIFLHQMAGSCVPSNDESCFPKEWFRKNRDFKDVQMIYDYFPLFADPLTADLYLRDSLGKPYAAFQHNKELKGLIALWLKAIAKYPQNFLIHEWRFFKGFWLNDYSLKFHNAAAFAFYKEHDFDAFAIQTISRSENLQKFPVEERFINFSPLRFKIYQNLFEHLPFFNRASIGLICILGFLISSAVLCFQKRRTPLFFLAWCIFFAAFFYALVVTIFSPVVDSRYVAPVFALDWIGFITLFVAFFLCKNPRQTQKIFEKNKTFTVENCENSCFFKQKDTHAQT